MVWDMSFWQDWSTGLTADSLWDVSSDQEQFTLIRHEERSDLENAECYLSWDDLIGQQ